MTPEQIQALWAAAQDAVLSPEQMASLSISNPYTQQGPIARKMQASLARVAPAVAQEMLAEAGTNMSLQAKAAQMGLAPLTEDLKAEIAAFSPVTPEQARANRIEELKAALPWGSQGSYDEQGNFIPGQKPNLTLQMELSALDPELAGSMKVAAQPPVANNAMDEEAARYVNSLVAAGYGRMKD